MNKKIAPISGSHSKQLKPLFCLCFYQLNPFPLWCREKRKRGKVAGWEVDQLCIPRGGNALPALGLNLSDARRWPATCTCTCFSVFFSPSSSSSLEPDSSSCRAALNCFPPFSNKPSPLCAAIAVSSALYLLHPWPRLSASTWGSPGRHTHTHTHSYTHHIVEPKGGMDLCHHAGSENYLWGSDKFIEALCHRGAYSLFIRERDLVDTRAGDAVRAPLASAPSRASMHYARACLRGRQQIVH